MTIINKLSLRRQIWIAFISILVLMVVIAGIAFIRLLQLQNQAEHIANTSQPAMLSALELKAHIQSTTSIMGLYIINKTPVYAEQLSLSITKLQNSISDYKKLPIVKNDKKMQLDTEVLENSVGQFIQHQEKIDFLNKNYIENYPGLKIANSEINPRQQQALQVFSSMIESELEESLSNERRHLLQKINDLRHNWMTIVALFRTYLSNPNPERMQQISLYVERHEKYMKQANEQVDLFTFEEEDGFLILNGLTKEYLHNIQVVFNIFDKGEWREDVSLIKDKIQPLITDISLQIDAMIKYQKQQVNNDNKLLVSRTQSSLLYICIVLLISLSIGILAARFSCKQINIVVREINLILRNI